MEIDFSGIAETDIVKLLFAENPGLVIQVADADKAKMESIFEEAGVCFMKIGTPSKKRQIAVAHNKRTRLFDIDYMRDVWFDSSYLMDRKQSFNGCADERLQNYKNQPLRYRFTPEFTGMLSKYGIDANRREKSGVRAAIIREKGTNGEREMAYAMYLAGFDVKDVTMTDLISGRETLDEVNFIVFCGGFSNSDVLGSAKGWAGGFLFNPKAKAALDRFYAREDTLSLGICNGCQLMMELNLINPEFEQRGYMRHNNSHKFESTFVGVNVPANNSVLFGSLSGSRLGVWVAHGEGRFDLPYAQDKYNIVAQYSYEGYPGNPNGSDYNVAALASANGRHVAMMPHPERAIFPWQCANYPADRLAEDVTPWIEIFRNAYNWVADKTK
jgi:phosphoribosylformylglycinamidine synthase